MTVLDFNCRFAYPSGFSLDFGFTTGDGVTALVGPSGSGKTTVLNLIAGLLCPFSGKICLNDHALFDSKAGVNVSPERRQIGYVFQDFALFPHLSVAKNLRYGQLRQNGQGAGFDQVVAILELTELLNRMPASLSGGQKQRVALGRAILRNPKLLLLDEPLNALDRELQANVVTYLDRIVNELKLPALLVSHDKANVAALATAVVAIA